MSIIPVQVTGPPLRFRENAKSTRSAAPPLTGLALAAHYVNKL
jgi:hypothetical protein